MIISTNIKKVKGSENLTEKIFCELSHTVISMENVYLQVENYN